MILRRVIQHFRNQEWTAIAIDLVIVVVGVYIGIQAQAWNVQRENRQIENRYLLNLHDEILSMIDNDRDRVAAEQDELEAMMSVVKQLAEPSEYKPLSTEHCRAITSSHIFVGSIFVPPTIAELLSTGRLQLIENNALRSEMVSFSQAVESYRQLITDIQSDRLVLSRAHPQLISLDLQGDDNPGCNFEAMRQSPAFVNDISDNRARMEAYVETVVVGQQDMRINLHLSLDDELGISHVDNVSD
jgi:hypothetical protein